MNTPSTGLPTGTWQVDPATSELSFAAKSFWGLMPVKGSFKQFSGTLEVTPTGADGELIIEAASLDTKNAKRDKHLRSADFFNAEAHPTLSFKLSGAEAAHGHVHLDGTLELLGVSVPMTLHTEAAENGEGLQLSTGTEVSREQVNMTWNQAGMIKDRVALSANLRLTRS